MWGSRGCSDDSGTALAEDDIVEFVSREVVSVELVVIVSICMQ